MLFPWFDFAHHKLYYINFGWYSGNVKYFLFGAIVTLVLSITAYLIWSTIATNASSVTGGPVHYHADFEIWNCGQKVDLIDPQGWSNKIGTPILHEHNDGRIHVEGPVLNYKDITLGKFFEVVGGFPLESAVECNGYPAVVQVFVYKTKGDTFYQEKIADYANYVLSPYPSIPPGDCIIIEFDKPKTRTDKLCNFYQVAKEKGELVEQ